MQNSYLNLADKSSGKQNILRIYKVSALLYIAGEKSIGLLLSLLG